MSDALLSSIDQRLQRVADDVAQVRVDVQSLHGKTDALDKEIKSLPSWKTVWGAAGAVVVAVGGLITWLSSGGAKFLAKFFE